MKKLFSLVLVIALVLSLVACGSSSSGTTEESSESNSVTTTESAEETTSVTNTLETEVEDTNEDGEVFVAFSISAESLAPYCAYMGQVVREMCESKGWRYESLSAEGDAQLQVEQVETLVNMGCDYIILWPCDSNLGGDQMQYAYEHGVKAMLLLDPCDGREEDYCIAYLEVDNGQEGWDLMEYAYNECKDSEYAEDGVLNVLIINATEGMSATVDQANNIRAFCEEYSTDELQLVILGDEYCNADRDTAMSTMETYLATYGNSIDIIISADDNMSVGCVSVIEDFGLTGSMKIYSQMGMIEAMECIADGTISLCLYEDNQNFADAIAEVIEKDLAGEDYDWYVPVGYDYVTIDNVADYPGMF